MFSKIINVFTDFFDQFKASLSIIQSYWTQFFLMAAYHEFISIRIVFIIFLNILILIANIFVLNSKWSILHTEF